MSCSSRLNPVGYKWGTSGRLSLSLYMANRKFKALCSKYIMTSQNYSSEMWHLCYLHSLCRGQRIMTFYHILFGTDRVAPRPICCFHRKPNSGFCINKYLTVDFSSFPFLILRISPSKLSQLWQTFNISLYIFRLLFAVIVQGKSISLFINLLQLSVYIQVLSFVILSHFGAS